MTEFQKHPPSTTEGEPEVARQARTGEREGIATPDPSPLPDGVCPDCGGDDYELNECLECGGLGAVPHPHFGTPSCPTPEVQCPSCGGNPEAYRYWYCYECGHRSDA